MTPLEVVQLILAFLSFGLMLYVREMDKKLRGKSREKASDSNAFLVAPLYWFMPSLYNEGGEDYRLRLIVAIVAIVILWAIILLLPG